MDRRTFDRMGRGKYRIENLLLPVFLCAPPRIRKSRFWKDFALSQKSADGCASLDTAVSFSPLATTQTKSRFPNNADTVAVYVREEHPEEWHAECLLLNMVTARNKRVARLCEVGNGNISFPFSRKGA